jgi:predicted component of viral defense system (DUF524 family)
MSSSVGLAIETRRGGEVPRRRRGVWQLDAEVPWVVRGPRKARGAVQAALPSAVASALGNRLLLEFGNAVGRYDGGPLGPLQVRSGKWTDQDFHRMLEGVTRRAAALPFSAGASSALPYLRDADGGGDVLYHAFVYLRHVLSEDASRDVALRPALAAILRKPHRRLQREGRIVPLELASRVDPPALIELVAGRYPLRRAVGQGSLSDRLRGHLPLEVEESVVRDTFDTAENRFIKAFLDRGLTIAQRIRERAQGLSEGPRVRLCRDCDGVERALLAVRRAGLWSEVGRMAHLPAGSTVLQGRPSYRTVFDAWRHLHLGSRLPLNPADAQRLLEVKDIALLYELWCCFGLVDAVTKARGDDRPVAVDRPDRTDLQATVRYDWQATWKDGTAVTYNPRFSRARDDSRRSYSVPLRPDLALEVPRGKNKGLHLFDAKFRLDRLEALAPVQDADDEGERIKDQERRSDFKRADLYKMHAYRDAIPRARSAWVLYPGTTARFFGREHAVVDSFDADELPAKIRGVGGVPMPGAGVGPELVALVGRLLGG